MKKYVRADVVPVVTYSKQGIELEGSKDYIHWADHMLAVARALEHAAHSALDLKFDFSDSMGLYIAHLGKSLAKFESARATYNKNLKKFAEQHKGDSKYRGKDLLLGINDKSPEESIHKDIGELSRLCKHYSSLYREYEAAEAGSRMSKGIVIRDDLKGMMKLASNVAKAANLLVW